MGARRSGFARRVWWWCLSWVWAPLAWTAFRQRATGTETLPAGGYLLFANHVSALDTAWVAYAVGRPVWFMASANLFRNPVLAVVLDLLGAFPKEVGVKDPTSAGLVQSLVQAGEIVQIMPEGQRTWDGRPHPIAPGTGRMVKRLGVPVVVARIRTGHLWWPRWATWPRWVPVFIAYQPPRVWPADADPEAINADIQAALDNPVTFDFDDRVAGFRMAEGLPDFLWACPHCGELGALQVDAANRCRVRCRACDALWRVTVDNHLVPEVAGVAAFDLGEAADAIAGRYGVPPVADPGRFATDGVVLEDPAEVVRLDRGGGTTSMGRGRLRLTAAGLSLSADGGDGWSLPASALLAVRMDVGNVLLARTAEATFRLAPDDGSTRKWEHFLRGWLTPASR